MKEVITHQMVADKLAAYLQHDLSLANHVAWAESAMMEGEFEPQHFTAIRDVVARLGVADVRAFGLTWDDCEQLLKRLGYAAHVQIMATQLAIPYCFITATYSKNRRGPGIWFIWFIWSFWFILFRSTR